MKRLAIDTSTETASVALQVGTEVLVATQDSPKTHAQSLLPMIDTLMAEANMHIHQLDGIVFGCGPGSFTGLRIACSVAKGLAYAHDLGLIPVSSLASIAWSVRQQGDVSACAVLAVLDARMHEMYWAYCTPEEYTAEHRVTAAQDIVVPDDRPIILAGVGIDAYWADIPMQIRALVREKRNISPCAAAMLAWAQHTNAPMVSAAQAEPVYIRNQVTQGAARG